MKKILGIAPVLFLLLAIITSNNAYAQKNKVKSLEFKNFEREEEQKEEALKLTKKEYKEFDAKGRMITYQVFLANPIGELVKSREVIKAWEEHSRTEAISNFDEMGDAITTEKSHYSIKDNVKTKVEYTDHLKAPNDPYTKLFTYTSFGKPNKITIVDKNNKKIGEELYKYNSEDEEIMLKIWKKTKKEKYQHIKKTSYNDNGTFASREIQTKDGKDTYKETITFGKRNKIEEHIKYKNGKVTSQFGGANKPKYDPSKQRVLVDFGSGGGASKKKGATMASFGLWATEDEFDDNGNKIKTIQTTDGEVTQVTEFKYDEQDNMIESVKISYNEGKEVDKEKEVLAYDQNNNMLKKAIYSNGVLISEKTYDYTYH